MKLGNTGGGNLGKKYLKIKGDEVITPENQLKLDAFNKWFSDNYLFLKKRITKQQNGTFDDEVFHETYIRIATKILYGGLNIKDYAFYFHRSYFTNTIQLSIKENRFVEFDLGLIQQIDESEENIEIMKKQEMLTTEIKEYVQKTWPEDYNLFKLSYEEGLTLSEVTAATGMKFRQVQNRLSIIKNQIKKEFEDSLPKQDSRKVKQAKNVYCDSGNATLEEFSNETIVCVKEPKADIWPSNKIKKPINANSIPSESEIILQLINDKKVVPYSMYEDLLLKIEKQQQNMYRLQSVMEHTANNMMNTLSKQS